MMSINKIACIDSSIMSHKQDKCDIKKLISIIVPVFNESEAVAEFLTEVQIFLSNIKDEFAVNFEIVFVDDGSSDNTSDKFASHECLFDLIVIQLSRNFGKEAAMSAGLRLCSGDAAIIMDVDLQDPPALLKEMVAQWLSGAPVVLCRRIDRSSDGWLKSWTALAFYRFHNWISSVKIPENVGDFRMLDRSVINAINDLPENRRFMKGLFAWVGFSPVFIDYTRPQRRAGVSKFNGWKLWRFAIEGITSFSDVPLVVWTYVGAFISLASFLYGLFIVGKTILYGSAVPGYASLLTSVLFLGGIQILGIGILGEYIGRIYSESKRRPSYVISKIYEYDCNLVKK